MVIETIECVFVRKERQQKSSRNPIVPLNFKDPDSMASK